MNDSPFNRWAYEDMRTGPLDGFCREESMSLLTGDEEEINSLNEEIDELRKALKFYADHGNWLIESESGDGYVNRIEWNASGDLWRAPWKMAEHALHLGDTRRDSAA